MPSVVIQNEKSSSNTMQPRVLEYQAHYRNLGTISNIPALREENVMADIEKTYDYIREDLKNLEARIQHMTDESNARAKESEDRIREEHKTMEERIMRDRLESQKLYREMIAAQNERIQEMDKKFEALSEKIDTKMDRMADKIDNNNKHLNNLAIATIVAIAAIVISIWVAIWLK